jgi:SpoVK/Ycf46/Vps4 family AAA+-type ATPase
MFQHIFESIEDIGRDMAARICAFAALIWAATLVIKFLARMPLSYAHGSFEFYAIWAVSCTLLLSLAIQLIFYTSRREPANSVVLAFIGPWVFVATTLVMILWLSIGPAPGANFVPLGSAIAISGLSSYAVWYGPMSEKSKWIQSKRRVSIGGGDEALQPVARAKVPSKTFAQILGNDAVKSRLLEAGKLVMNGRSQASREPRNGVLLHGDPGNGKTAFAEALAGELKLPFLQLSVADVASKWVGEKTSRIRQAFDQAMQSQPCMLFIDEIDALLEARDGNSGGVKEDRMPSMRCSLSWWTCVHTACCWLPPRTIWTGWMALEFVKVGSILKSKLLPQMPWPDVAYLRLACVRTSPGFKYPMLSSMQSLIGGTASRPSAFSL